MTTRARRLSALGVLLCASVTSAARVPAQVLEKDALAGPCLDTISHASFRRVIAYVEADSMENLPTELKRGFRVVAGDVANTVDSLLGARDGALARGEPALSWRDVGGRLAVTAYRDGRLIWSTRPHPAASSRLLARALDAEVATGLRFTWPGDVPGDSAVALLDVALPAVERDGTVRSDDIDRTAVPAFSLAMPPWTPVLARPGNPVPRYPPGLVQVGVVGVVLMQFVVDTLGRADMRTVHDVWLAGQARPTGALLDYYRAFRGEVVRTLPHMRFDPARVAGCRIRQLVQMPFQFTIDRRRN